MYFSHTWWPTAVISAVLWMKQEDCCDLATEMLSSVFLIEQRL